MNTRLVAALFLAATAPCGAASIATRQIHVAPYRKQEAQFINNLGDVIVQNETVGEDRHLEYYLAHPPMAGGQLLPITGESFPTGLNDVGQIIGSTDIFAIPRYGFIYQNGQMQQLAAPDCNQTRPTAINNTGQITVVCDVYGSNNQTSFLYENGIYTPIAVPGAAGTYASAINQNGVIAGTATYSNRRSVFFTYDHGTYTTTAFEPLDSIDYPAINDAGVLAVSLTRYVGAIGHDHSYLVYPDGHQEEILDPDGADVGAVAINNANEVTGSLQLADGSYLPFYYHNGSLIRFVVPAGYQGLGEGINATGEMAASLFSSPAFNYKGAYVAKCRGPGC